VDLTSDARWRRPAPRSPMICTDGRAVALPERQRPP